jgi:hypothetical protein
MGGSKQIPKPNTREIGEFSLVKLPQTTPKNPYHTKAKKLHHKSKEATLLLQSSLLKPKQKEPPNKYLIYLLLKPKSHSSKPKSNQSHTGIVAVPNQICSNMSLPIWEDPWAKATKLFVVLSLYKILIYILWWTRNTFLGRQIITF